MDQPHILLSRQAAADSGDGYLSDKDDDSSEDLESCSGSEQLEDLLNLTDGDKDAPQLALDRPHPQEGPDSVKTHCDGSEAAPFDQGFANKPFVVAAPKPDTLEGNMDTEILDFDDFFDDLMNSFEMSVDNFFVKSSLFLLVGIWSCLSMVDALSPAPIRMDWFAFCLISIKVLHRSVRASILMIFLLLVYFTIINTCILSLFNAPMGSTILPAVASISIYSQVCLNMDRKKPFKWILAAVFVAMDIMFKKVPKTEKDFLSGAHCISFTTYSALSKLISAYASQRGDGRFYKNLANRYNVLSSNAGAFNSFMASADLGDPGKRSEVHLHIQSISPDQAVLIWSLSGFTISNLASADEKLDLISKSVRAPDIHVPKNALETLQKHRAMTMKKSPSKGLSEWDYLVFRSKKAPNTLKAVTASDIVVKLNGVVCPKADVSINMKKQHLSIKLAPSEEYEVVVTVSDIGSEAVRVATPKKVAPDKRRGGPLYFKPTTYRSVGVSAVDTSTPSDCCCSGVSNSETAIIVENQPLRNARFTRLDSLKKELHYLQNEYKSGLANLKKLKRDFTRVSYNVKSEIDACQHNLIKDVSIEHKTKQRFQMIQDFLQANETWIKSIGDERFETVAEAKKLKDGELRALTNEIHRLRETIKNSEKNYSKQTSHMAKSITVASAEISALLKIHDEGQKELKLVDGDLSSLKNIELSRIECKIDNAWSKQSEIRENIEQIVKDRERIIVEKKHSLKSLRLTCESLHTKNNDFGQLLKEKRVKNDRLCEELMKFEDGIKDDRPAKGNRKSRKPKLMEDYSSNQTWNMENMNW